MMLPQPTTGLLGPMGIQTEPVSWGMCTQGCFPLDF